MKKLILIVTVLNSILLLNSCSRESYDEMDGIFCQTPTRADVCYSPDWRINAVIEQGLIQLIDGHYTFSATDKQCIALSLNDSILSYIQSEISKANAVLDEYMAVAKASNQSLVIDNTFSAESMLRSPVVSSQTEQKIVMPSGTLTASSNASVLASFTAPITQVGIAANCYANVALLPFHYVKTTYAGGAAHVGTVVGNGSCNVAISMSNTVIDIEYRTTDSNGGICSWVGITSM